jgi:hypothetical protein
MHVTPLHAGHAHVIKCAFMATWLVQALFVALATWLHDPGQWLLPTMSSAERPISLLVGRPSQASPEEYVMFLQRMDLSSHCTPDTSPEIQRSKDNDASKHSDVNKIS